MEKVFSSLGITIDPAPSVIDSLRYQSFDETAYFNHEADTFNYIYREPVKPKQAYELNCNSIAGTNPFDDFNQFGNIESLLLAHGWTYQHTRGSRKRFSRPGKSTGISADYCSERKIFYLFSNDPATGLVSPQRGYNNVQVFCQLECGNDWKLYAQKLKKLGYGTTPMQVVTQANSLTSLQPNLSF